MYHGASQGALAMVVGIADAKVGKSEQALASETLRLIPSACFAQVVVGVGWVEVDVERRIGSGDVESLSDNTGVTLSGPWSWVCRRLNLAEELDRILRVAAPQSRSLRPALQDNLRSGCRAATNDGRLMVHQSACRLRFRDKLVRPHSLQHRSIKRRRAEARNYAGQIRRSLEQSRSGQRSCLHEKLEPRPWTAATQFSASASR